MPVHQTPNLISPLRLGATFLLCLVVLPAQAQERIYRCGNEYTNNAEVAKAKGCKTMEGGNITIVQGTQPATVVQPRAASAGGSRPAAASSSASRSGAERVDSAAQRARDSDARAILENELRKAEERLSQVRKEYANGEPEKQGIEGRNHQRYLDRVAELKASLTRAESDVTSLRRELGRLPGGAPAPSAAPAASAAQ